MQGQNWSFHLSTEVTHVRQSTNKTETLQKSCWDFIHLLAGERGGCHLDLGHPLLLSGVITGLDQQRWRSEPRELKTPGGIHCSICLYPEIRWVTAFKAHQTTLATVEKPHCKRRETDIFQYKISQTVKKKSWKKNNLKNKDKRRWKTDSLTNTQTDRRSTKVFWFSLSLIHYSLQAVPQRYFSKQVQWRRELEGEKTEEKREESPLRAIKDRKPKNITFKIWCVN